MNDFLGKFSLSLILRQLFCGIVFFVPFVLSACPDCPIIDKISKLTTDILLAMVIASLIIGTIIYHVEKNTYSYVLQGLFLTVLDSFFFAKDEFCSTKEKESETEYYYYLFRFLLFILIAGCLILPIMRKDGNMWTGVSIAAGLLVLNLIFSSIVSFYQKAWSISGQKDFDKITDVDANQVMGHLDTWSDNIHCVQCCCFAWLAGSTFSHWLNFRSAMAACWCMQAIFDSSWDVLKESIKLAFLSPYGKFVCILLLLELVFEFHRFRHLYKIVNGR